MTAKIRFERLNSLAGELDKCTECGYCTFWCPIYQEEPRESSVARGKLHMAKELLAGEKEYTEEFADALHRCMLCMTCAEHCQAGTKTPEILIATRADSVRANGIHFPYNIIYRWLIPHRTVFGNTVRLASWCQGIFFPKTEGTIRHLALFLSALGKGRHIPSIAPSFLRQQVPVVNRSSSGNGTRMRVGYFIGCMTDFVFPHIGKRTIDFLTRNGVDVVVPRAQGCCGAPVYLGAGDFATGRRLADANVKAFADANVDYVVCDCATCTSAMKDYVKFLADTPERQEAYSKFAGKLRDISEFLVDVLKLPPSAYKAASGVAGKRVTWHDPCHLNRYLGVKDQPRQIIRSIPGVEFVDMTRPDWCCGMAGTFSINYYDTAKKIASKKIETIKDTGADILATGCPGCMIQFIDNITRHKMPVKVMHIMELIQ